MANKSTKKALLLSVLSMLMCVAMLVGSTFAWFTDSVTSGKNTIYAGNLDVELKYLKNGAWTDVENVTDLFDPNALWEPGHAEVVYLQIKNAGTLDLKYQFSMNVISETVATNVLGDKFTLSQYLMYGVADYNGAYKTREDAIAAVKANEAAFADYSTAGNLLNGEVKELAMVVYMPTTVGNEANYRGDVVPSIDFGLNLIATQMVSEYDSFGNTYDENASLIPAWDGVTATPADELTKDANGVYQLGSAEDLAGFAALVNGGTTKVSAVLTADINLGDEAWTPIGTSENNFNGTFDGNGYTIYNLNVSGTEGVGLIGFAGNAASIYNVKIVNATVNGNHWVGAVLGYGYLSANSLAGCTVENATIVCKPVLKGDVYDDGNQAGAVAGMAINGNIYNNKAINCTVYAYRDLGGIVGCAQAEDRNIEVYGNSVENVTLARLTVENYNGVKDVNMNDHVGRSNNAGKTVTVGQNFGKAETLGDDTIAAAVESKTDIKNALAAAGEGVTEVIIEANGADVGDLNYGLSASTVPADTTVTIKNANFSGKSYGNGINGTVIFENCTFTNTGAYSIHFDSGNGDIIFNNCTLEGWCSFGSSINSVTMNDCIIRGNGKYAMVRFYQNAELNNCYIDCTNADLTDIYTDGVSAVNPDKAADDEAIVVELNNCEVVYAEYECGKGDTALDGIIMVDGVRVAVKVDDAESLEENLKAGNDVILTEDVTTEAATTAPYGNKVGVILNGGTLDGNGNKLDIECYGDDYGIMTTGGTVKNITIEEGCRAVMIMYPTQDVILDNVNIGGDGVLYPINTGEAGDAPVKLVVTNSTLAGWTSYGDSVISSASFTNVKFEQGTYYNNIYGRVLKPYCNTTLTDCSFIEHMNLDLSSLAEGQKVTITNCTVNGQKVTAGVFTVATTDEDYDTALFSTDLPSWATSITDCVIFN